MLAKVLPTLAPKPINKAGKKVIYRCGQFVDDRPECWLLFAVWARAVRDAFVPLRRNRRASQAVVDAARYLAGDTARAHLNLAGVDPDFAVRVMAEELAAATAPAE